MSDDVETFEVVPYRDFLRDISPIWLKFGIGLRLLYAIGVHLDLLIEMATTAIKHRLPGLYSFDALPYIGRERRIRRGLFESDSSYADRLTQWRQKHRRRGNPYGLLDQLFSFFAPNNFEIELVYYSGRRFTLDENGLITRDEVEGDAPSWPPDATATQWARWWLFYHVPSAVLDDGTWDDPGEWDDGGVWDSGLTAQEVSDLRLIPTEWNTKHALGRLVLLSPGVTIEDWLGGDTGTAEIWIGS